MLIGVIGLTVGLAVGGVVLVAALGYSLQRTVDSETGQTAEDVAALVDAGVLPEPVPVTGANLVQVVDGQGRVRSSSVDADRLVPILYPAELAKARAGQRLFVPGDRIGLVGPVRVVVARAGPPGDEVTVIVARPVADVVRSVGLLRTTLLVIFPVLVAVLAAVAWRVIGATLRPVEALRRGAEEITGRGAPGRLPVPAGRDEVHRLAETLNDMLDRLESNRLRQRAFVADAAHELRSPLANMRTQLEVAQRLGEAAPWPAVADDVLTDTNRLARLVDDLLLLARGDDDPGASPRPAVLVELGALISELGQRHPSVEVEPPRSPLWTEGEPDALHRVVANLLDNAVRHARSRVVLSVREAPAGTAYHIISVTDDGPGIPAADRDRVFDRFTRLDDARARDAGGAGLGLAIVRELVRRLGGTVTLSDADPAPGLTVALRLRAAHEPTPASSMLAAGGVIGQENGLA
jgi:signal transduction histidine kinase